MVEETGTKTVTPMETEEDSTSESEEEDDIPESLEVKEDTTMVQLNLSAKVKSVQLSLDKPLSLSTGKIPYSAPSNKRVYELAFEQSTKKQKPMVLIREGDLSANTSEAVTASSTDADKIITEQQLVQKINSLSPQQFRQLMAKTTQVVPATGAADLQESLDEMTRKYEQEMAWRKKVQNNLCEENHRWKDYLAWMISRCRDKKYDTKPQLQEYPGTLPATCQKCTAFDLAGRGVLRPGKETIL